MNDSDFGPVDLIVSVRSCCRIVEPPNEQVLDDYLDDLLGPGNLTSDQVAAIIGLLGEARAAEREEGL